MEPSHARRLVLAVTALAAFASFGALPAAGQSGRDPSWTAEVEVACPDGVAARRTITQVRFTVGAGQTAELYLATFDAASNGFRLTPVGVDGVVPAQVVTATDASTGPFLQWAVVGVTAGPWPVDAIVDTCRLPETGAGTAATTVAAIGVVLVVAGLAAVGLARRRMHPAV